MKLSTWTARPFRLFALAGVLGLLAGGAEAQTRYVAFGDSITEGVGDDDGRPADQRGYPSRLENTLNQTGGQDAVVENWGLGGERTPGGVTRIDEALAGGGDVLLLMEGTNDISQLISQQSTLFNLREMARKAEQRGFRVVLATLIPRLPNARVDADNFQNQELNQEIRSLAARTGRGLVDPFEVLGAQQNLYGELYWANPQDPVGHPNDRGYDLLASVFADVLTETDTVPPVTGVISPNNGQLRVAPSSAIQIELLDFGAGIDLSNTSLFVEGNNVQVTPTGTPQRAELVYNPPGGLGGIVDVRIRTQDLANPPNTVEKEISRFVIRGTTFLDGDFNRSGRVDGRDLVQFARLFGTRRNDRDYRENADFNQDGIIDGTDLAVLAANFGASSG